MSICADTDHDDLENNENLAPANICDTSQSQFKAFKKGCSSQDIFSDDEQPRNTSFSKSKASITIDSSFNISLKTPILCSKVSEETPGKAIVPRTPVDLLPFITKTSIVWTSDMETPQSKLNEKSESCDKTFNSVICNNTTPKRREMSPNCEEMKMDKTNITSPVLGGKKRSKRRVKRRLLNNIALDLDNNNDQASSISSNNSDKMPSDAASSVSNEIALDEPIDNIRILDDAELKENKLEEVVTHDKNSNTSTQEFFSNASFGSIDRLCSIAVQEEIPCTSNNTDNHKIMDNNVFIKKEIIVKEENKTPIINNDVLERVAAIKRNQKPLKRSTDVSHTVIPKEAFFSSVIDLEIADAKFTQEKKVVPNIHNNLLKSASFTKLSAIEDKFTIKKEVLSPVKEKEENYANDDVPVEIMDDWNLDKNVDELKKENLPNSISILDETFEDANFFSGSGKKIAVSEINLQKRMKIFNEIENEVNSADAFLTLGKSNTKSILPKQAVKQQSNLQNTKVHVTSKTNFSNDKLLGTANNTIQLNDGFSKANGKIIPINEDKLLKYTKMYNEIENEILSEGSLLGIKKNDKPKDSPLNVGKSSFQQLPPVKLKIEKRQASGAPVKNVNKNTKCESLQMGEDSDLNTFLEPKFKSESENIKSEPLISHGIVKKKNCDLNVNAELPNYDEDLNLKTKSTETVVQSKVEVLNEAVLNKHLHKFYINEIKNECSETTEEHITKTEANVCKTKNIIPSLEDLNDGFSTARGKGIKISEEKESLYMKIYSELSDDIENEHCFLNMNKTELSKVATKQNPTDKAVIIFNKPNSNKATTAPKLSISSDADEAFYDLGDLENLFTLPNPVKGSTKISVKKNGFTVPNSTHIPDKVKPTSSVNQSIDNSMPLNIKQESSSNKENMCNSKAMVKNNPPSNNKVIVKNNPPSNSIVKLDERKNNIYNEQMEVLKRKLNNCEVKKPERCRSFGGFPVKNESASASKLNKSDPHNESSVNQPLQTGLSVSQCFDLHSDSWLSKVEISYLNNTKVKSPDAKVRRVESKTDKTIYSDSKTQECDAFCGFSFKDCTESFRYYARYKKLLEKQHMPYSDGIHLSIDRGKTIFISNKTSSKRQLFIQYENNVNVNRCAKNSYNLVQSKLKPVISKLPETKTNKIILPKISEQPKEDKAENKAKRKHADTDSDTPLTTVKKPRVGCEVQGRKLFSDESDADESIVCDLQVNNSTPLQPVKTENIVPELEEEDLSEQRIHAILLQDKLIRNKKRTTIKPTMGSLLRQRLLNSKARKSWVDIVGDAVPTARTTAQVEANHPDAKILEVTASNAACYKFLSSNKIGNKKVVSLDVGDGAQLIFDEKGHAGVSEFAEAFTAMPGVDPKLIPAGWIENHYKWIIWKLASMDRIKFNSFQLPKMLTPERVMKEIKYRYDREIDRAHRPALRRILEKDDAPTRRMVLCISSIKEITNTEDTEKDVRIMLGLQRWKIEATDGWYSIPLTIDNAMANYVLNGKIKEGTKIMTYGAELLDCERGCYPLEMPANVSLKIHTNCTRRARWDAKLGYQQNCRPMPMKLRNIVSNGGLVGEITAVAARVYPLLYREKTADGQSIYRNARSEEKAAIAYEKALELKLDVMYAEAQKQLDSNNKRNCDDEDGDSRPSSKSKTNARGHDLWEKKQNELKEKLESQVRQGLPTPRNVTAVLKVRLVDGETTGMLTIWGANEESGPGIKEGDVITLYNSHAMGTRAGELNLTANRKTHVKTEPLLRLAYPARSCTLIPDVGGPGFEPKFAELDTVGLVVSSGPAPHGMKNFEVVNLAYPKPDNAGSSYLSILFWNGMAAFGYQGMLTAGTFIACSNLEWRRNTSWNIAVAYCSEKTVFTCNPRQIHLVKELRNLKALIQNATTYAETCAEEVASELARKPQPRSNQGTPSGSFNTSAMLSPLEHHSPGVPTIQRRLEMLSRYGNTTDVSPIVVKNSSARVSKEFTPVVRRNT